MAKPVWFLDPLLPDGSPDDPLPLVVWPDPQLAAVCQPVPDSLTAADRERIASRMLATLRRQPGAVGLAAPQVGLGLRVIAVALRGEAPQVLFDPVLELLEGVHSEAEGCLSIPGASVVVARPAQVRMRARLASGTTVGYTGGGLRARVLQHEVDHLDGLTILDHASPATMVMLKPVLSRLQRR